MTGHPNRPVPDDVVQDALQPDRVDPFLRQFGLSVLGQEFVVLVGGEPFQHKAVPHARLRVVSIGSV